MKKAFSLLVVLFAAVAFLQAQDPPKKESPPAPKKATYKIDFKLYEQEDGKRINQREYSMVVAAPSRGSSQGSVRIGTRVPVSYEEKKTTYMNVGLELIYRLSQDEDKVWANIDVDINSFALPEQNADPRVGGMPILRNSHLTVETSVTPGKPQVVSSIDDPGSKKRTLVEVTATKLD
jgi:hypothetical protein